MGMGMVAGLMDVFGAAAFVAGTACYNRYLSRWSYRRILSAAGLQWRHPSRAAAAHGRAQPPCGLGARLHTRPRYEKWATELNALKEAHRSASVDDALRLSLPINALPKLDIEEEVERAKVDFFKTLS